MAPRKNSKKATNEATPNPLQFPSTFRPPQASNYTDESLHSQFSQSNLNDIYRHPQNSQHTSSFSQSSQQYPTTNDYNNPHSLFSQSYNSQNDHDGNPPSHFFRQNHNFLHPITPPPPQPQPEVVTETEPNKHVFYQVGDDIILAKAWVNITDDPITANEQLARRYWARIVECFNRMAVEENRCERGQSSIKNRMNRMKNAMTKYVEAMDFINREYHSGWDSQMAAAAIATNFAQRNNGQAFKFGHCVDILLSCSKYNFRTSTHKNSFLEENLGTPSTPTGENSSQGGSTRESGYSGSKRGSDEISSPSKRPIGNKAAKGAKGKGRKLEMDFEREEFKESQKKLVDMRVALAAKKMQLLDDQIAEAAEEARLRKEQAKEDRIMKMDPSTLVGEARDALIKRQRAIIARLLDEE